MRQVTSLGAALDVYRAGLASIRNAAAAGAAKRDIDQRRGYATDPHAYARDIFGYTLTPQQEEALDLIAKHPFVMLPSAQNTGKSFINAIVALWRFDCVAALPDRENGVAEQGARILLPGPDHETILHTTYENMLKHATRAESRGYAMPGERSEKSVLWRVPGHPHWTVEPLSPPKRVNEKQAHTASGRHHRNQHAIIEEAIAIPESLWQAVEGMCSGAGNTILAAYNPTEPVGPAPTRAKSGVYVVYSMSALKHPNIKERREVVPGAVSHERVDRLIRLGCTDVGSYPETAPAAEYHDIVYALPPAGSPDPAPRKDGHSGHAKGELRVYRPGATARVSVLGITGAVSMMALFRDGALAEAADRWRKTPAPQAVPHRVGADPARFGSDETAAAPAWGLSAEELLRMYADAMERGAKAVEDLRRTCRARVGEIVVIAKGDGVDTAEALLHLWPSSPFIIDDGGIGVSCIDHLARVLEAQVTPISFGGSPPTPTPGEEWSENFRTAMYVRAARCTNLGLVDVPPDPQLHEELLAHDLEPKSRSVEVNGRRERVSSVLLSSKDDVKAKIGRSPDKADAFVLSLTELFRASGTLAGATGKQKLAANYQRSASQGMFSGRMRGGRRQ